MLSLVHLFAVCPELVFRGTRHCMKTAPSVQGSFYRTVEVRCVLCSAESRNFVTLGIFLILWLAHKSHSTLSNEVSFGWKR
jgi:hypothetical protein